MAIWWITEAVPVAVTALLPLLFFPALEISPIRDTAAPYANPLIFLFLGGFLIASGLQRWGLHRRIALAMLAAVGTRPAAIVGGFMAISAALSMWVSNTATAAMMLPVGLSIGAALHRWDHGGTGTPHNLPVALMLGIAYGATIGGLGTLIGTPPNALFAGYMLEAMGREIGFATWMAVGLPLVVIMLPLAWGWLVFVAYPLPRAHLPIGQSVIAEERQSLGRLSKPEIMTGGVFLLTALLWVSRPLFAPFLPEGALTDSQIAILGALLMFALPLDLRRGEFLLDWASARQLPWRVLILFGGGLSLAGAVQTSGLAFWIGSGLQSLDALPLIVLVLAIVTVVVFLTELTSNTATAAAFLPVAGATALSLEVDVVMLAAPIALSASCAFMMPVATPPNAVVFGSGEVTIPQMCRAGFGLNLIAIALISTVGYGLIWLVLRG